MNATDIENALTIRENAKFHFRRFVVVPNISWGMNLHECDLLVLTKAGHGHEVEIKVTRADLKRDAHKRHNHNGGKKIRCLWFAGPADLEADFVELAPERAGIIVVTEIVSHGERVGFDWKTVRTPKPNKNAQKWTEVDRFNLARLGTMRFWSRRENFKATIERLEEQLSRIAVRCSYPGIADVTTEYRRLLKTIGSIARGEK